MADDAGDRIEQLVFEALDSDDPKAALEELVAANPELEDELRRTFAELERWDLLDAGDADDGALPERLGTFRLVRRLGSGGMGVVYLAEDEDLRRTVALKVIRPEQLLFPGARERFQREVETIARLQHPGIVPIYSVGRGESVPYFAMEHVVGGSLGDALDALRARREAPTGRALLDTVGRLGGGAAADASGSGSRTRLDEAAWPDVCVAIAIQVASALQHAHERGILHRDVKPSNILLRPDGRALLVDFGLAWNDADEQRLTRTQGQLGSLPYMPPELVDGAVADPSRQADVYGLGVTLYEMLTLRSPFLGDAARETRRRILEARPAPLRRADRSISWELETVCLTAMDPDPAKRYRTAADLLRELERVRDREPIVARRPGPVRRTRRWAQRHPSVMAAAIVALLALAVSLSVIFWNEREARRRADRLHAESEQERYSALLSTANLELAQGLRAGEARRALRACPEDLKGWEWEHLEYLADESVERIDGLGDWVESLTWLADGSGIWMALQDASLRLYGVDGGPRVALSGAGVSEVGIDPGSGALVAGTLDGRLEVRDPRTGAIVAEFDVGEGAPLAGQVTALGFDPEGRWLFSACADGRISQWDLPARRFVRDLGRHGIQATCLAVRRDGGAVVSGGYDRKLRLFAGEDLAPAGEFGTGGFVTGLAFGPDGTAIFAASGAQLEVFEAARPERARRPVSLERGAIDVQLSPDGTLIAVVLDRRALHILRLLPGGGAERLARLRGHDGIVHVARFRPDGGAIATAGEESTVRLWDPAKAAERALRPHPTMVQSLAPLGGDVWVSGDVRGGLRRTDLARNEHQELASPHGAPVLAVGRSYSPVGWVSVDAAGNACRWAGGAADLEGPEFTWSAGELIVAAVAPGGVGGSDMGFAASLLAVGDRAGRVRLQRVEDGSEVASWPAHDAAVSVITALGDGSIWTGAQDGTCREWDRAGKLRSELEPHPAWIAAIALSSAGEFVATTCADTGVRVFERRTSERLIELWGHVQTPLAAAWIGAPLRLVTSGGFDPELRFWEPRSGRCLVAMRPQKSVTAMAFDETAARLVTGNRVGELVWLERRPGGPLAPEAADRFGRLDRATSPPGGHGR